MADAETGKEAEIPSGEGYIFGGPPSREHVLDDLESLAAVEHALCVEYLSIHCALGHDTPPPPGSSPRVPQAAQAAFGLALSEMKHFHRLNQVLTLAGRRPQVGRASSISEDSASEIPLGPPSTTELQRLVDREREIAAAVDRRYAALCSVLASQPPLFDGELLDELTALADLCPDHSTPLGDLRKNLEGIPPSEYLRATRRVPGDDLERSLLELSDGHYGLVVGIVRAWFAHEDELGGELFGRAVSAMDGLNAVNGLLVARGLLPPFTLPVEMPPAR
ncbi:MAG: hypothetical protein M3123_06130 [Actinomycetota bacterium]|nr:hypothetical protein [Actinomycetota bacterium]